MKYTRPIFGLLVLSTACYVLLYRYGLKNPKVNENLHSVVRDHYSSGLHDTFSKTRNNVTIHRNVYYKLVDYPVITAKSAQSSKTHTILFYNNPKHVPIEQANRMLSTECVYTNCKVSDNRRDVLNSSAIIFFVNEKQTSEPLTSARPKDQVWISIGMEPPTLCTKKMWVNNGILRKSMNWTISYRQDADIFRPYRFLKSVQSPPVMNYSQIFYNKTKFAVWVVSHCHVQSRRYEYVESLKQYGIQVDIFGKCAPGYKTHIEERYMDNLIDKRYKFYLGFENSLCKDYITEKFFKNFALNTIVVARGGADYDHLLPNDTFIDTSKFKSIKSLAKYLMRVGSNEELYSRYLREKSNYRLQGSFPSSYCTVCEKLNNLKDNRKTYEDLVTFHCNTSTQCVMPSDIH